MARSKYDYWLTDDGLLLLRAWSRDGLTQGQIAQRMGIAPRTLSDYKSQYPQIKEALAKDKDVVDAEVEAALLKKALEGSFSAQAFWLKNRKPEKWCGKAAPDKQQLPDDPLSESLKQLTQEGGEE